MGIDVTASRVADAHLARLDAAVPGLVIGLHVIGSATLGDYRPGISDLDLVAELARPAGPDDLAAIATAHKGDGHAVETIYLPKGALAGPLSAVRSAPWVRDGEAHTELSDQLHPLTWLQLARYSATLRGAPPAVEPDVPAAQDHCRDNLVSYWQPLFDATSTSLATRVPDDPCRAEGVMWLGLGPMRLWHTIRTGEVIGKTRAGELAAERWPEFAGTLRDLLAARAGEPVTLTNRHGAAAVELGRRIVRDVAQ